MLAIASGGAAGASLRWAALHAWPVQAGSFPWPVLLVNLVGSWVLGLALAEQWRHPRHRLALHDWLGVGFCGGLTTMSTFAVETAQFMRASQPAAATVYLAASAAGAVGAAVLGAAAGRRVVALRLPVEGRDGLLDEADEVDQRRSEDRRTR